MGAGEAAYEKDFPFMRSEDGSGSLGSPWPGVEEFKFKSCRLKEGSWDHGFCVCESQTWRQDLLHRLAQIPAAATPTGVLSPGVKLVS